MTPNGHYGRCPKNRPWRKLSPTPVTIRTLIVDDDERVRSMILRRLEAHTAVTVVGAVESGERAIEIVAEVAPDVVVLDQSMPGLTGTQTAPFLRDQRPEVVMVLFTAMLPDATKREAAAAGIARCVLKPDLDGLVREVVRLGERSHG